MEVGLTMFHMSRTKKVATNIPEDLLAEATALTGLNQTQALIAGLRELIADHKRHQLLQLRGRLDVRFDTRAARQRKRL
jgi:hypothetical protein